MSIRHILFEWSGRRAVPDLRTALQLAGALPDGREWRAFLDRLLLWSGALALAASVVFFIAYNWHEFGKAARFALVELLVLAAALGYWRLGPERAAGKASLLVAAILLGALLALFGQTYQTGADTWELFATWAALMVPWVVVGRMPALWVLWVAVANVAIVFYFAVFPGLFGLVFGAEHQFWTLFLFDSAALVVWELAARRIVWLDERWAPRLLAVASGAFVTILMFETIFEWNDATGIALAVYPVWLVCLYVAYRRRLFDLLVLAGGCLSIIVVVTAFLAKNLLDRVHGEAAAFLLIAITVVAMGASSGWWLKKTASEVRT
jgi:uncharacterized membrane protein